MIEYYCKKCNAESPTPVCSQCGKKLPANSMRNVWRVYRVPLADRGTWLGIFEISALISLLLFLLLFGAEFFMTGVQKLVSLFSTHLPALILSIIPAALIFSFIVLLIQGREILIFALDVQGAHMQVWHPASKVKCWARFQSARMQDAVPQADGQTLTLSQVRHTLWKDVRQVKYSPKKGEIRLYHTFYMSPLVLRLPPDEYEGCEAMVKKFCKGKA